MDESVARTCTDHTYGACPDQVVIFNDKFTEYGLPIRDGAGGGVIVIAYCPFCGAKLPESGRDAYFDRLQAADAGQAKQAPDA